MLNPLCQFSPLLTRDFYDGTMEYKRCKFMNEPIEKLLTAEEAAKILRVSYRSIVRYIEQGKLKASKIGMWRIKQSDLDRFLEETSNQKRKKK